MILSIVIFGSLFWFIIGAVTASNHTQHGDNVVIASFFFWPLFWLKAILQFAWKAIKGLSFLKEGW